MRPGVSETLAQEHQLHLGAPIAFLAPLSVVPDGQLRLQRHALVAYGGGPLGADMARKLAQAYRSDRFMQVWATESGLWAPCSTRRGRGRAGSIGRCAIPGVELEVRRQDGSLCGPGEVGEICLRSAAMMQGYLDSPRPRAPCWTTRAGISAATWRVDEDAISTSWTTQGMIVTGGENVSPRK
jgi:feruloyl-CoA synthase